MHAYYETKVTELAKMHQISTLSLEQWDNDADLKQLRHLQTSVHCEMSRKEDASSHSS